MPIGVMPKMPSVAWSLVCSRWFISRKAGALKIVSVVPSEAASDIGISRREGDRFWTRASRIMIGSIMAVTMRWCENAASAATAGITTRIARHSFAPAARAIPAPMRSVQDVIAEAKRAPGKLTFASSGNGTNIHLVGELFKSMAGVDMVHVPYKGSAPALTDLMGGSVALMFDTIPSAVSHVKSGKLRALGVTGAKRSPVMPEVPTIAESGLPGYEVTSWYGLIGPAEMPPNVITRLNREAARAAGSAAFRGRMEPLGFDVVTATPARMVEMLQADSARWGKVIKAAGVTIN